jgi:outer membrane receptor for ferrienterochelin and colicin
MKKLLVLTLTLASFGFFGLGSEGTGAKASTVATATPQVQIEIGSQRNRWRRNNRRVRRVTQTRIVRRGYRTYRETYLITYFWNGRTDSRLISRERIG